MTSVPNASGHKFPPGSGGYLTRPAAEKMRDGNLLKMFNRRDRLMAEVRALDERIDARIRDWSFANGYRVPLRREAVRREVANG